MKILVVDDHDLVREGLRQVLRNLGEETEVLLASNCKEAFALANTHGDLDVVLLDYHLPEMSGLDALDIFAEQHPELPVIALSGLASAQTIRQVIDAGAAGFVSKSSLSDALLEAVRVVLRGDIYYPKELTAAGSRAADLNQKPSLTKRQRLVVRCLMDGLSNREIADRLFLSEETVKSHIGAILRYFDAQNRTQAVLAASREGYTSPSWQADGQRR
jgi:DNA-binding NarL/FixJ family response regulator